MLLIAVYGLWLVLIFSMQWGLAWWVSCPALTLITVQFLSLQHEALHGHPTRSARLNEALVSLPLALIYPYRRYKSLHLHHHNDENLTDPFDDPESWYFEADDFARQHPLVKALWRINATLLGRLVLGRSCWRGRCMVWALLCCSACWPGRGSVRGFTRLQSPIPPHRS